MNRKRIRIEIIIVSFALAIGLNSCYYNNAEDLYPHSGDCDTSNISYSNDVWPIINNNCTDCHGGSAPAGNIGLENHDQIKIVADNGKLLGTINHEDGYSPMPKGGGKLADCSRLKIDTWVNMGSPDN